MTIRVITLWRVHITSLTASVSAMLFLFEIVFIFKAIKSYWKLLHTEVEAFNFMSFTDMRNGILHSWSCHMKFTKLAESSFIYFILNDHSCNIYLTSLLKRAPVAQWVKRWPTDLAYRVRSPLEAKSSHP